MFQREVITYLGGMVYIPQFLSMKSWKMFPRDMAEISMDSQIFF